MRRERTMRGFDGGWDTWCQAPAEPGAGTQRVPLIPREVLFGNPDRAAVRVSPDGRHLAFLAPLDGVLNVWVAPIEDAGAARPVTRDAGRGIRGWTSSAPRTS